MLVRVTVTAGARKERVIHVDEVTLTVTVREKAEGNKANTRVREIVAEIFHMPFGKVRMLSGHRTRTKVIRIG